MRISVITLCVVTEKEEGVYRLAPSSFIMFNSTK